MKVKQISDIHTKLNYFKDYCFSIGVTELDEINSTHANTYIVNRSQTKLKPSTLNMEFRFIKRFFNYYIMIRWIIYTERGWRSGLFNSGGVLKTHPVTVKKDRANTLKSFKT